MLSERNQRRSEVMKVASKGIRAKKLVDASLRTASSPESVKLSSRVADSILHDIAVGGWLVGAVIGQEAQLMVQYNVSRATLREAVRQLECQGVATMRRGFGGGLIVQASARRAASQALATFLELNHVRPKELYEAKEVLEIRAIRMASKRLSNEHIDSLRQSIEQINTTPFDVIEVEARLHSRIRRTIADAAGNPALSVFLQGLNRITQKLMPEYAHLAQMSSEHQKERELRSRQVEAIIAGDVTLAEQVTREQLVLALNSTEHALRTFRSKAKDAHSLERGAPPHVIPWDAQDKLPHRLASAIALEISEKRLSSGSLVGSEPEFMVRYGVSRAVFREAVRLLESYCIVQMRRGFGGGLVVGSRSPEKIVSLVASYLRYAKLEKVQFLDLLGILYIAAAPLAAKRAAPAQALELLERARAIDPCNPRVATDAMRNHFREILVFTENPALILIGEVTLTLSNELITVDPPPITMQVKLKQLHCDLLTCIANNDPGMARRRMNELIDSLYKWYGRIGEE